jgi:hypothetical protein
MPKKLLFLAIALASLAVIAPLAVLVASTLQVLCTEEYATAGILTVKVCRRRNLGVLAKAASPVPATPSVY